MISLELATENTMSLVFRWRNDPEIVALSASQKTVTWEEHEEWFKTVNNGGPRLYLIRSGSEYIGTVRFDHGVESWYVSIYMELQHRGKGYGTEALKRACAWSSSVATRIRSGARWACPRTWSRLAGRRSSTA